MEFRILGPLEVLANGQALALGGQKQRAVLALLLLEPNRVVSTSRLIDALWEDEPPETAAKALQVYVSQLRRLLGRDRVETKAPGYRLRVNEGELDVDRVRRLVEEGSFDEALAHWRGVPLSDLAPLRFAEAAAAGLEELRLSCLERRIERGLDEGRHLSLVGELQALVAAHPLRERARAQLMLALYRSGRQADALEVFQSGRRLLAAELGLEPGEPLKRFERMILAHDPSLEPPSVSTPTRIAEAAASSEPPARPARKMVTMLLAEVTPESRVLDPELLRRVTSRALAEMRLVLERHGGTVERLLHGGVSAVFGVPIVHEDDGVRAVRAALEVRERLSALNAELEEGGIRLGFRVGVDTGEVVTDQASGVVGETVASAARLQQAATRGEILIGSATRRVVGDAVLTEPADEGAHRVLAAPAGAGRRQGGWSPMIGRVRERRRLRDAFEQAVEDASCQLFTILGVAGVGKSRLVQEFLDELGDEADIARGRCLPYGEGITYWPVVEAIRESVALDDAESAAQSREKLVELLTGVEERDLVARRVAALLGLTEWEGGAEEGQWAIRTLFEALARRRPLVLVFDDVHWGESGFLDLIEQFADWSRDVRLLLVCIARPELLDTRPGWGGGKVNATTVLLEPLSDRESSELVDQLAHGALDPATRRRVIAAAEGNPLFVEEMLALALEAGGTAGELEVPPTIQALLAARLDRLEHDERLVLECAAIEGKVFHQDSVDVLLPDDLRPALPTALASLVRKDLVRSESAVFAGERGFRFRHLLIRDAAYDSIAKEARAAFHERHAAWLEQKAGSRIAEFEEIVGYHLEQAFRYQSELAAAGGPNRELARRAAQRLGAAGRRAFLRSDSQAAVNLISRAAALLPSDDPTRIELIPNVRIVQGMSGDLTWATEILDSALGSGDARLRAHARIQHGFLRLFTDLTVTADELLAIASQAVSAFATLRDELGLARAWRLAAQAHYLARRAGGCVEASEHALVHARRAGDAFEVKEIVEWLAVSLGLGPTIAAEADRRCEELLEEIAGERFLAVTLLAVRAYLVAIQGRREEAQSLIARARETARDANELYRIPYFALYTAFAESLHNPAEAAADLRSALRSLEELDERTNYTTVAAQLALAACARGDYGEAEALSRTSEAAARENDVLANVLWRCARARASLALADLETAESLARDAVAFAEASDFLDAHGFARVTLAAVLEARADGRAAALELARAVDLYEQKGNVVSAAAARRAMKRAPR